MRQISKVVLLVAPVLLAASGCASKPAWVSQKSEAQSTEQVAENRTQRLLQVAQKYEENGKPDVAYQLYRHIANQDPACTQAKSRMAQLAPDNREATVQLASKSRQYQRPANSPSIKPKPERKALEIDWEEAKRQTMMKTIAADVDNKKVGDIKLSYEGSKTKPSVPISNGSLAAEVSVPRSSAPESDQQPSDSHANASTNSDQIAEFQRPVVGSEAKFEQPLMSQEWWDAEFKPTKTEVATTSTSVKPDAATVTAQNEKIAQPIPEQSHAVEESTFTSPATSTAKTEMKFQSEVEATPDKEVVSAQELCTAETSEDLIQVVALLDCPEPEVRIAGLIELGIKGSEAACTSSAVRSLLHDEDAMVRAHAAGTVRDIEGNNSDSVEHLASLLSEKDQGVVQLSCYLLGQMGIEARPAVTQLKQIRDSESGLTSLHAAEALTRIVPAETRSYGVLKNALSCNDPECRVFAAVSLGGVYEEAGHIAALALVDALDSHDPDVRASAALSLGGLGKHAAIAVPQLQEISDHDEPEVRDAALTALACLGK